MPEPVFGIIKSVLGLPQFLLRGIDNVTRRVGARDHGLEYEADVRAGRRQLWQMAPSARRQTNPPAAGAAQSGPQHASTSKCDRCYAPQPNISSGRRNRSQFHSDRLLHRIWPMGRWTRGHGSIWSAVQRRVVARLLPPESSPAHPKSLASGPS
jgi:hypothetical protein